MIQIPPDVLEHIRKHRVVSEEVEEAWMNRDGPILLESKERKSSRNSAALLVPVVDGFRSPPQNCLRMDQG